MKLQKSFVLKGSATNIYLTPQEKEKKKVKDVINKEFLTQTWLLQ